MKNELMTEGFEPAAVTSTDLILWEPLIISIPLCDFYNAFSSRHIIFRFLFSFRPINFTD